jgi:hypothetical protein
LELRGFSRHHLGEVFENLKCDKRNELLRIKVAKVLKSDRPKFVSPQAEKINYNEVQTFG